MLAMPWPRCSPQNCGCQNYIPILHEHDGRFPDCWCALQSQAKCVLLCFLRLSLNMGAFPSPCFVCFFLMRTDWFMWNHCMIHAKSLRSKCALHREACDAMQCNAVQQQGGVRIGSEADSTGSEVICLWIQNVLAPTTSKPCPILIARTLEAGGKTSRCMAHMKHDPRPRFPLEQSCTVFSC
jgi:hypothetical protein